MDVQEVPSRECHAVASTSVAEDPRLLPMTTSPPWPSSEKPWATNRRPSMPNAPEPDRCVHVEPSVVAQTVVVEPVVATMSNWLSRVVKYGPKSSFVKGGLVALCQSML